MLAGGIRCEFGQESGSQFSRQTHMSVDTVTDHAERAIGNAFEMLPNARPTPHTARAARATRQRAFGERPEAERRSLASRVRWGAGSARVGQVAQRGRD